MYIHNIHYVYIVYLPYNVYLAFSFHCVMRAFSLDGFKNTVLRD